jgi:energy-coupling factor transport system permease protein
MRVHYHTTSWLLWLLAALLPPIMTRNPFYLLTLIAVLGINYRLLGQYSPVARNWRTFLRFGLFLVAFSVLFNVLFNGTGATILLRLPQLRLLLGTGSQPVILFQAGGPVTLEGLSYGLASGLDLMAILMALATFNMLVDHYLLLRSIPRFLYQTGVIVSIGITFVPQMVVAQQEIRQAQVLRGHRFSGVRDLLPLFVTMLVEGLERAIGLAESMEARGFSGQLTETGVRRGVLLKMAIAFALLLLAGGTFALAWFSVKWPGGALSATGMGLLALALWLTGQGVERSRYHRELWRQRDTMVSLVCLASLSLLLLLWLLDRQALDFYPYPRFAPPLFNPLVGPALLAPAAPALVTLAERATRPGEAP